ncbi:LLM class flavin-dependent oxidoreductase [Sphingobium lignivorans]|uniref:Luciferase family oxidoreductase group 1 n=1 Tax=Sphingobium lignivorans TaxID=2735886 RepID=A0ABR6NFH1_9SPHN|nr:LLM class flavin-dependent oxidoreductase [Sphingobium lignivorans]MBB5985253.1 luciferase family oxidoreductase group 1 [Sphingobium lignivorans]
MTKLSFLDLVNVVEGETSADAIRRVGPLAAHAEAHGYHRYWIAEHHGMEGVAAAATSLIIAEAGRATSRMRIGSGGIMLPNHSPLVIAEQFGTLDALFPGRVDLGLGRAPGADSRVARALRRDFMTEAEEFPRNVVELRAHFTGDPDLGVLAVPGRGADIEMWILGSSLFGAQLAAALGMPYAFASHFAPDQLDEALMIYRRDFRPSARLREPYAAAALSAVAADTTAEAEYIASSMMQNFVALRTGRPGKLPPPVENYVASLPPSASAMLGHVLQCSAFGSVEDVARGIARFIARTQVDEVIVHSPAFDPDARLKSVALIADAFRAVEAGQTTAPA